MSVLGVRLVGVRELARQGLAPAEVQQVLGDLGQAVGLLVLQASSALDLRVTVGLQRVLGDMLARVATVEA